LAAIGIPRELLGQNLNRNIPAEHLVLHLIHFTHAAFTDLTGDLIMDERFADHEETSTPTADAMQ
jgi:hypothetical protein